MSVRVDVDHSVATVTLDRPDKRNALSIALRRELTDTLRALSDDASVAVAVITGEGSAFCAGMDTSEFGGDAEHKRALYDSSVALFDVLGAFAHPLIGAINGPALGGGCALAAMCDVRIAGPAARFGHPEVSFGVPASYAALLRMAPSQVARELAFTGRTVGAEEALALGIVREVHAEPLARAHALAREMAAHGSVVLANTKRMAIAGVSDAVARAWEEERRQFHRALFGE
jgi:enoyl-CoA hydratase